MVNIDVHASHAKIIPSHVKLENVILQQYPVRREHASALTVSVQWYLLFFSSCAHVTCTPVSRYNHIPNCRAERGLDILATNCYAQCIAVWAWYQSSPTEPKATLYIIGLVVIWNPDCRNVHGFYVTLPSWSLAWQQPMLKLEVESRILFAVRGCETVLFSTWWYKTSLQTY